MSALLLLAPGFLLFEIWQLVISERYLGLKQIARNGDPRALGLSEITAFFWSSGILLYWAWMVLLTFSTIGRIHGLCLFAVSMIGFLLRRGCTLKWVLVVLTFEGAIRIGLLCALGVLAWRRL